MHSRSCDWKLPSLVVMSEFALNSSFIQESILYIVDSLNLRRDC